MPGSANRLPVILTSIFALAASLIAVPGQARTMGREEILCRYLTVRNQLVKAMNIINDPSRSAILEIREKRWTKSSREVAERMQYVRFTAMDLLEHQEMLKKELAVDLADALEKAHAIAAAMLRYGKTGDALDFATAYDSYNEWSEWDNKEGRIAVRNLVLIGLGEKALVLDEIVEEGIQEEVIGMNISGERE